MFGIVPTIQATSNDHVKEGYQDGREDALQGNSKNSYCDPDNSDLNPDLYCAIYRASYEAGYAAAQGLYGNQ